MSKVEIKRLEATRIYDLDIWWIPGLGIHEQMEYKSEKGGFFGGYPQEIARRLAASWNSCLQFTVDELEAGAVDRICQANATQVKRMMHLTLLAIGCKKHPSYRAIREPIAKNCECCAKQWAANLALKEMGSRE